ncbi:SDR family oxidoreductase [uncultured Hyphomonas sp.]|jgi:NAD(P)-dependent dehydrogenase (short-subunit alcohol dehydrogenase family)|uniref:SDR family NAD(P)-dependent oxidoreductase n=1 Tax=uncultured Hyphomonas sp. TaxID=225298 RepID=UPI0030DCCC2A|tara:strand:+ start:41697 stop:42452 length:756 start_codon:yes stop_codon:yes gene_type:complete
MTPITLVTGSSRGLGRNTALSIARKGGDVLITYRSRADAADAVVTEITAMGRKAFALQLDTGKTDTFPAFAEAVKSALQEHWQRETLDHLVSNAGEGINVPLADINEDQFDLLMNVHVKGTLFLTQALLPLIADGGRIVNISSGLTRMVFPGYGAYAAAKGAVEVLTRYMAKELGARGIAVNTVAPGAIETDFGGGIVRDKAGLNQQIAAATALGRVGLPDDIGPMIANLLSPDNRWVNAQRIEVSGGQGL